MKYIKLFFFLLVLSLVSCTDADLARQADGLWYVKLNVKDEYGIPHTEEQYLRFNYVESDDKDGGTLTETVLMHLSEDVDDYTVTYDVRSEIKGEWEVLLGDLYVNYDLYSLNVEISNIDYSPSKTANILAQINALGDIWDMELNRESIKEEIRKEAYKMLRSEYQKNSSDVEDDGPYYPDLQIEEDVMTFTTSDVKTIHLKRIKE